MIQWDPILYTLTVQHSPKKYYISDPSKFFNLVLIDQGPVKTVSIMVRSEGNGIDLPSRIWRAHCICACQIRVIPSISCCIPSGRHTLVLAYCLHGWIDALRLLNLERSFDYGCRQAGYYMPFHMAMQQPYTRVVRPESDHRVTFWCQCPGVTPHRYPWHRSRVTTITQCAGSAVGTSAALLVRMTAPSLEDSWTACHELWSVAMKMYRMNTTIIVVHDHFHQIALFDNVGIRIHAVYDGVCGIMARSQSCIQ